MTAMLAIARINIVRVSRRTDTTEDWIRRMRLSRVVSASGISRAFVPPCIPGASLRTIGLRLSDQHRFLDRNPRRTLLALVFARDVPQVFGRAGLRDVEPLNFAAPHAGIGANKRTT